MARTGRGTAQVERRGELRELILCLQPLLEHVGQVPLKTDLLTLLCDVTDLFAQLRDRAPRLHQLSCHSSVTASLVVKDRKLIDHPTQGGQYFINERCVCGTVRREGAARPGLIVWGLASWKLHGGGWRLDATHLSWK